MRRFTATLLVLCMLLATASVAAAPADYSDIKGHWAYEDIAWCLDEEICNGTIENTAFSPDAGLTRGMFVVMLYRLTKRIGVSTDNGGEKVFDDVKSGAWYTEGVDWAVNTCIAEGVSETHFGTNERITREQAATMLFRWLRDGLKLTFSSGLASGTSYPDTAEISSFAYESFLTLAHSDVGLFKGSDNGRLLPLSEMTRAEAATLLHRAFMYNNTYGNAALQVYIEPNTEKILQGDTLTPNGVTKLTASLAKNESEGMQFILNFDADTENVCCTVSSLVSDKGEILKGAEMYRQHYVKCKDNTYPAYSAVSGYGKVRGGMYPDALIPMYDGSDGKLDNTKTTVLANKNQGYWITATSAETQSAGIYRGTVTVSYGNGGVVYLPVEVTVWDFTVPTQNSCQTAFALWDIKGFCAANGKNTAYANEMEKMYYEFFLNYRISSTNIPLGTVQTATSGADNAIEAQSGVYDKNSLMSYLHGYLDSDKVSAYNVPITWNANTGATYSQQNVELLKALREEGLLDKGYLYNIDEPMEYNQDDQNLLTQYTMDTKRLLMKAFDVSNWNDAPLPVLVTTHYESYASKVKDWCPLWDQMTETRMRGYQDAGSTVWWYGCATPQMPYPTYHMQDYLETARLVHWMQRDAGATGELYWATTLWGIWMDGECNFDQRDVWTDPYSLMDRMDGYGNILRAAVAGDGYLAYPGLEKDSYVGRDVPVPTIRLEAIRDGFEDYEYLTMLENKLEKAATRLGLTSVSTDVLMETYYNAIYRKIEDKPATSDYDRTNPALLLQVREMMAEDIERDDDDVIVSVGTGTAYGVKTVSVYADKDAKVYVDGKKLTGTPVDGCYLYTCEVQGNTSADSTAVTKDIYVNGEKYTRIINAYYGN